MPVRKIPKSYRNVTGLVATDKSDEMTGYESRIEHDCQKLVGFNRNVLKYEEQPVKIYFNDKEGKQHYYHPDILITYRSDTLPAKNWRPLLVEVKYRSDLFKYWAILKPKFRAGRNYAHEQGVDFAIITDREIYTPYLKNVIFLLESMKCPIDDVDSRLLLAALETMKEADPNTLLRFITQDNFRKAELLPTLWQLVANYKIRVDLEIPLTMRSPMQSLSQTRSKDDEFIHHFPAGHARRVRWQALRYCSYIES
jgi:hypothetical protein